MTARSDPAARVLKELGLLTGKGQAPRGLLPLVHAGRVQGGLSIALGATPDEVFGPLAKALGGAAQKLRLLDVRSGRPLVLEVRWGELVEKWEVEDVPALVHNLNDLFKDEPEAKVALVLGEWEDMLQLICLPKPTLLRALASRLFDGAWNAAAARRLVEPRERDDFG